MFPQSFFFFSRLSPRGGVSKPELPEKDEFIIFIIFIVTVAAAIAEQFCDQGGDPAPQRQTGNLASYKQ